MNPASTPANSFHRNRAIEQARRDLKRILRIMDAHEHNRDFYILDLEQDFRRAVFHANQLLNGKAVRRGR